MQRFDSTVWSIRAVGGFRSGYRRWLAPRTSAFRCLGMGPLPWPPIHPGPWPRPALRDGSSAMATHPPRSVATASSTDGVQAQSTA
jgi:hypothetical protein